MSIQGITLPQLKEIPKIQQIEQPQQAPKSANFAELFNQAVQEADALQTEADKKIEGLALGNRGITTHDAMIALEKADIAFDLMNQVRSKIIRAYEEVLRTQV